MKTEKKKRLVSDIQKVLAKNTETSYEKGARDAMSIAVNLFNCEERIRSGVLKEMKLYRKG